MATPTVSDAPATQRQYVTQLALSAAAGQALRTLWTSIGPVSSEAAWRTFSAATRALMPQYGQVAASTALDNYRLARRDAGIATVPSLPRIAPMPASKIDAGLDWARRAYPDLDAKLDAKRAEIENRIRGRAEAAMQKALLDEARETTIAAVIGDDKALGYRRVPRPGACAWCLALAVRKTSRRGLAKDFDRYGTPGVMGGEEHWGVYKSRAAAGQTPIGSTQVNRFHRGKCRCVVEAIFSTDFVVPDWLHEVDELYNDSDDFNDFRRRLNAQRNSQDGGQDDGQGDGAEPRDPAVPPPAVQPARVAAVSTLLADIDTAMTSGDSGSGSGGGRNKPPSPPSGRGGRSGGGDRGGFDPNRVEPLSVEDAMEILDDNITSDADRRRVADAWRRWVRGGRQGADPRPHGGHRSGTGWGKDEFDPGWSDADVIAWVRGILEAEGSSVSTHEYIPDAYTVIGNSRGIRGIVHAHPTGGGDWFVATAYPKAI
ncbi:hypothetical protein [Nocardioides sp. BYT-33-1]|uniref:VG15 protein n=1 Tax=Nocardioides sp. BYT-33-1 TaxID=3416952 RepID=UPI003F52DA03